jgi:hypothetical protein
MLMKLISVCINDTYIIVMYTMSFFLESQIAFKLKFRDWSIIIPVELQPLQ